MSEAENGSGSAVPLSRWTKIAYGFGASAYGVKNNGFDYFLMLFYGTVIGVDPRLIGLAILIALVFDAISDPLVGYLSDNWRSKWGRRHPFMYASAVPVALSYFCLWNPPDWSDTNLFIYVTVLAVFIRTMITFYETPSSALSAELTQDYDQRTNLQAYRLYFAWTIGNLMSVLMWGVLLATTAANPLGQANPDSYATYGIIGSAMIFGSIMISALGTHSRIPHLQPAPPKRSITVGRIFKEIFQTLSDKSFAALFVAALFGAVATGVAAALAFVMLTYFWEFTAVQLFIWTLFVFPSAMLGAFIAPQISKRFGKKRGVIGLGIIAFGVAPLPVVLRLLGLMPPNGDPSLFPIVLAINTIDLALIIALQALLASMIADLVEQSQVKTGRRSEGVFFAAVTFTRKATQGFGALAAGFVLAFAQFPDGAVPGEVSAESLWRLGVGYAPTLIVLWSCLLIAIGFYKIDRTTHEENLRKIEEGATATAAAE